MNLHARKMDVERDSFNISFLNRNLYGDRRSRCRESNTKRILSDDV